MNAWKKFLLVLILMALSCVAAVIGMRYWQMRNTETKDTGNKLEEILDIKEEVVVTGEMIRENLSDIGELATEEYSFTQVETYDSQKERKGIKIPFTKTSFVYSYDGTIKAGIDFSKVLVTKDDVEKLVVITLPKAEILSTEIDYDSFQVYDEKTSIFNPVSVTDVNDSNADLMDRAVEKALDKGVLKKAEDNAKTVVKEFVEKIGNLDGYDVKVMVGE